MVTVVTICETPIIIKKSARRKNCLRDLTSFPVKNEFESSQGGK